MTTAVVCSLYGGYDQPVAPVVQDIDCDWVLVADRPYDCPPWRVVVEPRPQLHPRLAAKVAKCRPDLYAKADTYVWVDASIHIVAADFVSWATQSLESGPIAQIPHPHRVNIRDEADVSSHMAKYAGLPVREQVEHHLASGYVDGWGLWATGVIATRSDLPTSFGDAWLREQLRWTYQDQLSEPPVLFHHGLRPVDLPGPLYGNPRFTVRGHGSDL